MPKGKDYGGWRQLTGIEQEDLAALVYGHLTDSAELRQQFLEAELKLSTTFLLMKHLDECRPYADEVIFMQKVRQQMAKTVLGQKTKQRNLDQAVRDLVDEHGESQGVFDIFRAAGLEKVDLSILDDKFLQTFKNRPHEDLRRKLLAKLLADEIKVKQEKNVTKSRTFSELLKQTLQNYHNRLIDAASVVRAMLKIKGEIDADDRRAADLNLEADELAFYDALAANFANVYESGFLRDVVHDVVQTIKRQLKVDWTEPHGDAVKAEIRAAVRRVLRRKDGLRDDDIDRFVIQILAQAELSFADWPVAA